MTIKIKNAINVFLKSVFFTSLCAPFTAVSISLIFKIPITLDFLVFIFFVPIIIYCFDFFLDEEFLFKKNLTKISSLALLFALIILELFLIHWYGNNLTLLVFVLLMFLGLLYAKFFKKFTKKIVGFKDFFVALNWNIAIWLLFIYHSFHFDMGAILILIVIFVRDMINTSFCDIKDITEDSQKGLKTFAVRLGKDGIRNYLRILQILSLVIFITGVATELIPTTAVPIIIAFALTWLFIEISYKRNYFPEYVVDSEYMFWFISLIIFKFI